MARSVLWIDSSEVAALLGNADSRRITGPPSKSLADELNPFIRSETNEQHAPSRVARVVDSPIVETVTSPPTQFSFNRPSQVKQPSSPIPPETFTRVDGASFEEELDRFLVWIENTFHAPDCAVIDGDGFVVGGLNPSAHLLFPIETTAFLACHLDDISEFSKVPLHGFYVFASSRGYSMSTWTEHASVRFFLIFQCEQLIASTALDEINNCFAALFAETLAPPAPYPT